MWKDEISTSATQESIRQSVNFVVDKFWAFSRFDVDTVPVDFLELGSISPCGSISSTVDDQFVDLNM